MAAKPTGFQDDIDTSPSYAEKPATPIEQIETEIYQIGSSDNIMPLGILHDGKRLRKFKLNTYTGDLELALSGLNNRYNGRPGDILPAFLSVAVDTIEDYSIADLAKELSLTKTGIFERLTLADALTILMRFRFENFGREMQLSAKCPSCGQVNQDGQGQYTDLSSCECVSIKDYSTENFEVAVASGYTSGGVTAKRFQLRPVRVYDLKRFEQAQRKSKQEYSLNLELLFYTVVDVPEAVGLRGSQNEDRSSMSRTAIEDIYRRLNARDRQTLQETVGKLNGYGMKMAVDMECSSCRHEWEAAIPWRDLPSFLSFPVD